MCFRVLVLLAISSISVGVVVSFPALILASGDNIASCGNNVHTEDGILKEKLESSVNFTQFDDRTDAETSGNHSVTPIPNNTAQKSNAIRTKRHIIPRLTSVGHRLLQRLSAMDLGDFPDQIQGLYGGTGNQFVQRPGPSQKHRLESNILMSSIQSYMKVPLRNEGHTENEKVAAIQEEIQALQKLVLDSDDWKWQAEKQAAIREGDEIKELQKVSELESITRTYQLYAVYALGLVILRFALSCMVQTQLNQK